MRTARVVAVVLALGMAGCAMDQEKIAKDEEITAARLNGRYSQDDPILQMLSPEERQALRQAGMMQEELPGGDLTEIDGAAPQADDDQPTFAQKAQGTMVSVLQVGVTLGMMVAPFLLF